MPEILKHKDVILILMQTLFFLYFKAVFLTADWTDSLMRIMHAQKHVVHNLSFELKET